MSIEFHNNINDRLWCKSRFRDSKVNQAWMLSSYIVASKWKCELSHLQERRNLTTNQPTKPINQSKSQPAETSNTMEKILTLTILALCLFATSWARAQPYNPAKGSITTTNMTWIWPGSEENVEIKKTCQVQGPDFCGKKLWKDGPKIKCGSTKKEWLQAVQHIMGLFSAEEKRECNFTCN